MEKSHSNRGFTLVEMLVVLAILSVLAAVVTLFLFRNVDRSRAAVNAANLKAARSLLEAELMVDPDHPAEVLARVMDSAPGAVGMDVPGLTVAEGTPMEAVITEDRKVNTLYGGYDAEDFENLYGGGGESGTTAGAEPETEPVLCGVKSCFSTDLVDDYCAEHQVKICDRHLREGDDLVPCGREYRDQCDGEHYKQVICNCDKPQSKKGICTKCRHSHYNTICTKVTLTQDNRKE